MPFFTYPPEGSVEDQRQSLSVGTGAIVYAATRKSSTKNSITFDLALCFTYGPLTPAEAVARGYAESFPLEVRANAQHCPTTAIYCDHVLQLVPAPPILGLRPSASLQAWQSGTGPIPPAAHVPFPVGPLTAPSPLAHSPATLIAAVASPAVAVDKAALQAASVAEARAAWRAAHGDTPFPIDVANAATAARLEQEALVKRADEALL